MWVRTRPETQMQRLEVQISDGADDVELLDNGRLYLGSGDIEMTFGQYPNEHHEKVGLAFRNVGLKRGAQVAHAEILFTATESDNEMVELEIRGVDTGNFVDFETHGTPLPYNAADTAQRPDGRDESGDARLVQDPPFGITALTDAVTWLPGPWSKGQAGPAQATSELKDVVNAIISRPDWREGNAMAFTIAHTCPTSGYGSTCGSVVMGNDPATNRRRCETEAGCLYAGTEMNSAGGVAYSQEYDHRASTFVESCSCKNGRRTATSFNRNQAESAKLVVYFSPTGYTDPCAANPCQNGGTCVASKYDSTYTCRCPSIDIIGFNCEVSLGLQQKNFADPIGPGWVLVRRVQQGSSWHPADDQLRGTDSYGQYPANVRNADQARATFSVAFAGMDYNQFLFESGDRTQWLIMDKKEIDDCDAIVASGIDRPWQPWHPSVRASSATQGESCVACEPAGSGWTKVRQGSVPGSNIRLKGPSACQDGRDGECVQSGVSLDECKAYCDSFDGREGRELCVAFEFGAHYCGSGDGQIACAGTTEDNPTPSYQFGDCQPQSASSPINYNSDEWNLDLYVRGDAAAFQTGYAVQQYCRPTAREDPWISVREHPSDIVYGEVK